MSAARPPAAEDGTFTRRDLVLPAAGERPDLALRVYTPLPTDGLRAGWVTRPQLMGRRSGNT
jgi:hypothetical protein